jgi:hypothetical protein
VHSKQGIAGDIKDPIAPHAASMHQRHPGPLSASSSLRHDGNVVLVPILVLSVLEHPTNGSVENISILVNGAPQPVLSATDGNHDLIQDPRKGQNRDELAGARLQHEVT